jgi:hypothetical protein
LTHGEDNARAALARLIAAKHQIKAEMPKLGDTIEFQ